VLGRRALALGFVSLSALAACQLIVGVNDEEGLLRPDAATADVVDDIIVPEDPCKKLHPPLPPTADKIPADAGAQNYVLGVRRFYARKNGEVMGYDLDGRCTGIPGSTTSDPPCTSSKGIMADADGGIDNALLTISESFAAFNGTNAGSDLVGDLVNKQIDLGAFTNLIGLFGYNGLSNDDEITVHIVPATGLSSVGCDGGTLPEAGPQWDGCDTWAHSPGKIVDGKDPVWTGAIKGYVADDVLVVQAQDLTFGLIGNELNTSDGMLTARIVRDGSGSIRMTDAVVAGRTPANELLSIVQLLELNGTRICESGQFLGLLRDSVCRARDLPLTQKEDGRGLSCGAISFAFGFEAEPVRLGTAGMLPDVTCDAGMTCSD